MKTTPFTRYHIAAGARMAPFAGYDMPIEFTGINDEHTAVRTRAGLFDVSHMGEIWVRGHDAERFLQRVTSNDVAALTDGKIQYSCLPNGRGGIVDDILVYRFDGETYLLVVNASNTEKVWNHLREHSGGFDVALHNASDETAQLALQGPLAMKIIQKLCGEPVEDLPYYTFKKVDIAGIKDAILSITGYTGAGGCEIYVPNEDADKLWAALQKAGEEYGMQQVGLGARDTLRLEMGYRLYGNDIDDTTSPLEAGLGWITKFVEGKDFIDRARLEKEKSDGARRRFVGFETVERGIPCHGYPIADSEGKIIGEVTSGTMSPTLKKGIGMGYVLPQYAVPGTELNIIIREKPVKARVTKN